MTKMIEVKWGSYQGFEGPWTHGSIKYQLPVNPTANERLLAVTTSTEGGALDAVQSYDKCVISCGLIQLCEARYRLTSGLLGYIASKNPDLMRTLRPALEASNAEFKQNSGGNWRFHIAGREVKQLPEQQKLFLLNSNGQRGSWDEASKAHAKLWIITMANFLSQEGAVPLQTDYVARRLKTFVMADAAKILFDDKPDSGWIGALRAGFVSFSANNPLKANNSLQAALKATAAAKWSPDWCISILRELTFNPGVTIYPGRYNKIRPVIERLYGVDLPDFADELKAWKAAITKGALSEPGEPDFMELEEVQQLLFDMGYDLGPAGVDGRMGPKTHDAIMTFQSTHKLVADGLVGPKTRKAFLEAYRAKVCE